MKEINNNIEEPVCSSKVSQLLKDKGFDVPTYQFYRNGELIDWTEFSDLFLYKNSDFAENTFISAPTHSIALEWIRVNFGIHIQYHIQEFADNKKADYFMSVDGTIIRFYGNRADFPDKFETPQEAIEAGLLYTLTNLIL